jgi:hypothetical protein
MVEPPLSWRTNSQIPPETRQHGFCPHHLDCEGCLCLRPLVVNTWYRLESGLWRPEGWEGIEVFDVSQAAQPFPIGRAPAIRLASNYAYVAEGGSGLVIYSLAPGPVTIVEDPASVTIAAGDAATLIVRAYGRKPLRYRVAIGPQRLVPAGDYLYVRGDGLDIFVGGLGLCYDSNWISDLSNRSSSSTTTALKPWICRAVRSAMMLRAQSSSSLQARTWSLEGFSAFTPFCRMYLRALGQVISGPAREVEPRLTTRAAVFTS